MITMKAVETTQEEQQKAIKSNKKQQGFAKGDKRINRTGLNRLTPEKKVVKAQQKAIEQIIEDTKREFAEALITINPALIKEANKGNIPAIKEVYDRLMGKPKETVVLSEIPWDTKIKAKQDQFFKRVK
jgi:hypothetical protein